MQDTPDPRPAEPLQPSSRVRQERPLAPVLVDRLVLWLMQEALSDADAEAVIVGCCNRLLAMGVPLSRGFFSYNVLHPLYRATGITWLNGEGSRIDDYPHTAQDVTDNYRASPFYYMEQHQLETFRCRLDATHPNHSFNILNELAQQGLTDYLAFIISFASDGRSGVAGSWATSHPDGFSAGDIEILLRVQQRLAVTIKLAVQRQLMQNIAGTYLGTDAGRRVLSGQIKRGDGEAIRAAILFTDLRGSTRLADTLPRQVYIDTLNSFFDVTGGAVKAAGGEILAFVGDGLLAIFPTQEGEVGNACERAFSASREAAAGMELLNAKRAVEGGEPLGFGISLHEGEVMFGNVGVGDRLSFSAFGAAVNEVVRIDTLTNELSEPILASDMFARRVDHPWQALGAHELRGVSRRVTVLAPAEAD